MAEAETKHYIANGSEVDMVALRPHPAEFALYFDA